MAGSDVSAGAAYSTPVAWIFIFNLIVGVGCLTLPKAVLHAGLILSSIGLSVAGFLAFITATWVVESMACANAIYAKEEKENRGLVGDHRGNIQQSLHSISMEEDPMIESGHPPYHTPFSLDRRVEIGRIAEMFTGTAGKLIFYVILCIYLYGDLAIYAVYVPNSLVSVTGGFSIGSWDLSEDDAYFLFLALFTVGTVPFCFFNFQKTKYMQFFTMFCRNSAFLAMIVISLIAIGNGKGPSPSDLHLVNFNDFPLLFGATIYAFMCHHSIPGLLAPVKNKHHVLYLFIADFVAILAAYLALSFTAVFAYGDLDIDAMYTLFFKEKDQTNKVVAIILALYPVFTLTTNFPLICITLRNNIMQFFPSETTTAGQFMRSKTGLVITTLYATMPPIAIAFVTRDVGILVSITGSYPGLGIMFLIPCALVFFARRRIRAEYGSGIKNPYASPFGHWLWLVFMLAITLAALLFRCIADAGVF